MFPVLLALLAHAAWPVSAASPAAPLFFVPNQGQASPQVLFLAKGSGVSAYLCRGEIRLRSGPDSLRIEFAGSSPGALIEAAEPMPGEANFLLGEKENWRRALPLYSSVWYRGLYPGIDMVYRAHGRSFKSEFTVAPGADPAQIQIHYGGAGALRLRSDGALLIPAGSHTLVEDAPVFYQERDGRRIGILGEYALSGNVVSFIVSAWDRSLPLVIDPILYSTILGGSSTDAVTSLALDSAGSAYVAGFTASYDFPAANPKQNYNAGGNEAFVAKLNSSGNGLVYCTYLGGTADDRAFAIGVDSAGEAVVAGATTSANFPLASALQSRLAGARNAFVAKLNAAGNTLLFSTYLGGSGSDAANGIALDSSGNIYLAGETTSTDFPASVLQKNNHGGQDAFIAKLAASGSQLLYSTFLGGSYDDRATAIAVDSGGTAYVTGSTWSSDFPTASALQPSNAGGQDAFVARLSADGGSLLFSTYLGGAGGSVGMPETGSGIAVDASGNAYVAGATSSANFPVRQAFQAARSGLQDAFAAKLSAAGVLVYSTYLGGTGVDMASAIAVNSAGNAYVAGQTFSPDLPVTNAIQSASGGDYDAFVAKLGVAGDSLAWLTYLGGNGSDAAAAVAADSGGNVYVAGWTLSTNFPVSNAYQTVNAGTYGGFVTKFTAVSLPQPVVVSPASGSGSSQAFVFTFTDPQGYTAIFSASMVIGTSSSAAASCYLYYSRAANTLYLANDAGTAWLTPIVLGRSGTLQNSQCSINTASSSAAGSGSTLALTIAITFQGGFAGAKNIYMEVYDGQDSGWQLEGSWTAVAAVAFGPVSVSPSSGSGSSQTFGFVYADPKGYTAITSASIVIGSSSSATSSCYLYYSRAANTLYLANDAGTAWLTPVVLGQSGTLQNSQCSVGSASSSAAGSGYNLTLTLALTFQSAFAGAKNIYMEVYDGQDSGWQTEGSWTVTSAVTLGGVSVTPASGSGSSRTFVFVFADPQGATALTSVSAIFGSTLSASGVCYLYYSPWPNTLYLANDTGTAWLTPVVLGQSGTLQNSQCSVNAASSSAAKSGTSLTLNVALTFLSAFNGSKNVYMEAYDGQDSGWAVKGTWTVQ